MLLVRRRRYSYFCEALHRGNHNAVCCTAAGGGDTNSSLDVTTYQTGCPCSLC